MSKIAIFLITALLLVIQLHVFGARERGGSTCYLEQASLATWIFTAHDIILFGHRTLCYLRWFCLWANQFDV